MGRAMIWLKKLLTGSRNRKEGHTGLKEKHVASDWHDGAQKERSRWSFVNQRKSAVDGGKRSEAVVTAAERSQVRPWHCGDGEDVRGREDEAAVVIQKAFRGYLGSIKQFVQLKFVVIMHILIFFVAIRCM